LLVLLVAIAVVLAPSLLVCERKYWPLIIGLGVIAYGIVVVRTLTHGNPRAATAYTASGHAMSGIRIMIQLAVVIAGIYFFYQGKQNRQDKIAQINTHSACLQSGYGDVSTEQVGEDPYRYEIYIVCTLPDGRRFTDEPAAEEKQSCDEHTDCDNLSLCYHGYCQEYDTSCSADSDCLLIEYQPDQEVCPTYRTYAGWRLVNRDWYTRIRAELCPELGPVSDPITDWQTGCSSDGTCSRWRE
jgi:multisubunit Na+/H+ antiporter MnhC subunit